MFRKKTNIDDVHSCLRVGEKYIAYYSSDFILRLLDSELLAPKFEYQFSRDFDFNIHEGCLYLSIDSELFSLNIVDPKLEKVCQTDNQYITALSGSRYLASSYRRKDKQYDNLIFDESCKLLWELNGEMSFRDIYETHLLLSDRRGNKIGYLNFENCEILWQHELIERISGESIETKKSIVVPISSSLVAFNRGTGDKEWENDFSLSDYKYDDLNKKLYGLGGNNFEVVNVETGEIEIKKELSEKLHISSHLTSYDSGLLYFSAYRENNIPIFGAVNVDNGELVFTQEVEMPSEKSFRKGLDRPVVVGNRLYVRDSMKTLHVFEKEETKEPQYS